MLSIKNNVCVCVCVCVCACMHACVFNNPSTAKVIRRMGQGFKSHPTDWRSQGLNPKLLVYKASFVYLVCGLTLKAPPIFCSR